MKECGDVSNGVNVKQARGNSALTNMRQHIIVDSGGVRRVVASIKQHRRIEERATSWRARLFSRITRDM